MSGLRSYQDLEVWKKSIDWAEAIYRASSEWPHVERFGLTSQVRRAAVSIPANIAEGAERHGRAEFLHFLGVAKGSLAEAETHLLIAERLGFLTPVDRQPLREAASEIGRMLSGLTRSLRSKA
ncbi:MAG: four helix bundle protein [Defluviicoccus sp.]